MSQTLPLGQSEVDAQPSHLCETGSQTGVSPGQSALFVQVVPQVCVVESQISPLGHCDVIVHCTHCFDIGSHTGLSPGHSALAVQVAVHWCDVGSHTGVVAGHCASEVQPTQVFDIVSQTGVMPVQAELFVAVHWTQMSSGVLHAGAALVQFASVVQPSVQTCVAVLQTPFAPVQSAFVLHWTHLSAVVSQAGVGVMQAVLLVASHWTHAPELVPVVRHAGSAAA